MKVGYFIPAWPPGSVPNGIVTTLGHLGDILKKTGHEVFYITPSLMPGVNDDRVFALQRPNPKIFDRLLYKWNPERAFYESSGKLISSAVRNLIDRHQIDIFQMEETQGWAASVIESVSIPVVVRLHGPWLLNRELGSRDRDRPEDRHRIDRERRAIFNAAAVAAPSEDVLRSTKLFYHQSPACTAVIPNPIFTLPQSQRWKLGDRDPNLILFVGRFDRIKGADLILDAFAKLAEKRPLLRLAFVGPDIGMKSNNGYAMGFRDYLASRFSPDVARRVIFYGTLARSEINVLRLKSHVTVVPSRYETFGNVVIEAMAFGCPIVAAGVGGMLEIVTDRRNGLISPPADAGALAGTLAELLDDSKLAEELGRQAAIDCAERFDPFKIGQHTIDFYSNVIRRSVLNC